MLVSATGKVDVVFSVRRLQNRLAPGHGLRNPPPVSYDLVVLAAGMGSRFGGLKQVAPVGPGGELIIEYSAYDARRAGFGRVVFVIRRDIEKGFRAAIGSRLEGKREGAYVLQELGDLPPPYAAAPGRRKPWGTGQAVLAAQAMGAASFLSKPVEQRTLLMTIDAVLSISPPAPPAQVADRIPE